MFHPHTLPLCRSQVASSICISKTSPLLITMSAQDNQMSSAEGMIFEIEKVRWRLKTWGWVVYRTTYSDDEKWRQFNEEFQKRVREITLSVKGGEHHNQYLDFPVRSDANKYNNATAAQLRADFIKWRESDDPLQEQDIGPEKRNMLQGNRYSYFIRVDEAAMQSLLDYIADGEDISVWSAWVDLVHVDWPESEGGAKELEKDDGYPPIEGITTYHVGFQRVPIMDLYPVLAQFRPDVLEVLLAATKAFSQ